MAAYTIDVDDTQARQWRATAGPGLDCVVVAYRCPQCGRGHEVRLQPPPWSHPHPDTDAEVYGGPDGHVRVGFDAFEAARVSGNLPHTQVGRAVTQLWCHPCGTGASAAVTADT